MRRPSLRPRRARARALSAHWDEVIIRAPAEPVTPRDVERADAAIVRRLHDAPGPMSPDASFADHLLDQILTPRQGGRPMSPTSSIPAGRTVNIPAPPRQQEEGYVARSVSPRGWAGLAVAAVVAVTLLTLWRASLRDDDPQRRRDTTAIAAVVTPAAASSAAASPTTGTAGQPVERNRDDVGPFSGVLDLSGPTDSVTLRLVELAPGEHMIPHGGGSILAMPIAGVAEERVSGIVLQPGQSLSLTAIRDEDWRLANTSDSPTRLLVASLEGAPWAVGTKDPRGFNPLDLGTFTFASTSDAALLDVSTRSGIGPVDTGREGVAILLAEESPTIVTVLAGEGLVRRELVSGRLQPPKEGTPVGSADPAASNAYLDRGDLISIAGGAAVDIRGQSEQDIPMLLVTLRVDSARLPQRDGVAVVATPPPTSTPPPTATPTVTPRPAVQNAIEPGYVELSVTVDADGVLAGHPTAEAEAIAAIREAVAAYEGCRVGIVLSFGSSPDLNEGLRIAGAVNELLAEADAELFGDAALENFASVADERGHVEIRMYLFRGCAALDDTPVAAEGT